MITMIMSNTVICGNSNQKDLENARVILFLLIENLILRRPWLLFVCYLF